MAKCGNMTGKSQFFHLKNPRNVQVGAAVAKDDTDDSAGENEDEDDIKQKNLPGEHEKEEMKQVSNILLFFI